MIDQPSAANDRRSTDAVTASRLQRTPKTMILLFSLLLTAIAFTVTGELLLKSGMNSVGEFSPSLDVVWRTFTNWQVVLGFALIFGGSLFWLGVISRVDFSFAYPLLALSYVVSLIPASLLLREEVTWNRILGACVIVLGVVIITWGQGGKG
jgi:drug/metabolite transporter (DMT)-like permease